MKKSLTFRLWKGMTRLLVQIPQIRTSQISRQIRMKRTVQKTRQTAEMQDSCREHPQVSERHKNQKIRMMEIQTP
ncbi:MAG: hypothetical protein EGP96_17290 [Roseburia inulinivorans]|nr:hypothetical protein [Roseburia inulinivorans]